ncbi:MAG: glutamate racemase [Ketobacteraceae bacterium]|nr:glutamate racemase [Ketobacteraceae bacterium]
MKDNPPHRILIFDSGIGGLSINDEIKQLVPDTAVTYVADNRIYPYGTLSEQALIERIARLFPRLIERFQPEAIVIACNSASTLVLDHLRELTRIPVIGVVPAIKPAAQYSQSRVIGLLATPGTVRRAYTDRLIQDFASHCRVIRVGSHELVDQAENKLRGLAVDRAAIRRVIAPFLEEPALDTIVLGCTHFPFLRQELNQLLGDRVTLIDSGQAIARRTDYILKTLPDRLQAHHTSADCFIFTRDNDSAHHLKPHLLERGFASVEFIDH